MDIRTRYYLLQFAVLALKISPYALLIVGSLLLQQKLRLRSARFTLLGAIVAFLCVTANMVLFQPPFDLLSTNGMISTAQEMEKRFQLLALVENSLAIISAMGILLFSISFLLAARKLPKITTPK